MLLRVQISPRVPHICPVGQIGKVTSLKRRSSLGSTPRLGTNKEFTMKKIILENVRNKEKFSCKDLKDIQVIDGIEYLRVVRQSTNHECLIKKDLLRKVVESKVH
jgi:hypothetical protein